MTATSILNDRFAIPGHISFVDDPTGITMVDVKNRCASARVCLQGAQLLSWSPVGQTPVVWVSESTTALPGKSLRGGIPVCWPWFGAHESRRDYPSHGYARTTTWEVTAAEVLDDGHCRLVFQLKPTEASLNLWPYSTPLECHITVGDTLGIDLITQNTEDFTVTISEALHTYFVVGDIAQARVYGLEDTEYLDKVNAWQRKLQHGAVVINDEVDRVYLGTRAECVIDDPVLGRKIHISKQGSDSTVVWNPWSEKSRKMGDMGEDGYRNMLCVETANAAEDAVRIAPGETHKMSVQYRVISTE